MRKGNAGAALSQHFLQIFLLFNVVGTITTISIYVEGRVTPWTRACFWKRKARTDHQQSMQKSDTSIIPEINVGAIGDIDPKIRERIRNAVGKACVPHQDWSNLEGDEFDVPEAVADLARSGFEVANDGPQSPKWKPSTKFTENFFSDVSNKGRDIIDALGEEILVWFAKFDDHCYGHTLPLVKTRAIVNMSPKAFAELLMDSNKVKLYNKMSLGRTDVRVFQAGVDTVGEFGDGEAKVVRNLTKPPLTKKTLEFVTLMHARKLNPDHGEGEGYLVVSRAVNDRLERDAAETPTNASDVTTMERLRSEILLGVNVLRAIEGEPNKTDLTSVTHVNSPLVPALAAKKVGLKGAVDFIRDIR
eukprot:CAMPEP_0196821594 /NCGR_PEP_ID=MMETSP1362-20130617/79984_1 /TAXON_ID=163516 /ORGANISM="Leptocylindrus danicus, Strain CCMP1856" /LENGTH=359 /DNA_ID=CAMNT_0042200837 /DNA_START=110 /DNA_END=1186 /DNA_ORIENTATION=+